MTIILLSELTGGVLALDDQCVDLKGKIRLLRNYKELQLKHHHIYQCIYILRIPILLTA